MKRLLVVMLVLFCLLSFSFGAGSSENTKSEVTQKKNLEFYNDKMIDYTAKTNFQNKLCEIVPTVNTTINAASDVASYRTMIQQSIRTDKAPGLFTWWGSKQLESLVKNDLLVDLTDLWNNYLVPQGVSIALAAPFTFDGKIYATPYSVPYQTILYNKKAFTKAGISEVPKTFDEFIEDCEKLKSAGITPIALKNDSWAGFIWFQQVLAAFDPALYKGICNGKVKYTDTRVVTAMNAWKKMIDNKYFSKPLSYADYTKQVAIGDAGMVLDTTTCIKRLELDYGLIPEKDFDAFQVPSVEGKKNGMFFEIAPLCIPKASAMKEAGLEVLQKWYTEEIQTCLFENFGVNGNGSIKISDSVYNNVLTTSVDQEHYDVMLRFYENTPEDVRDVALDAFMKFQMGDSSVEEMLNTCQTAASSFWK